MLDNLILLRSALKKTRLYYVPILIFSLFAFHIVAAQTTSTTDGSTPLGLSPGSPAGSYPLSGFENVNPYNGNLNFHLPLTSVVGRGGFGMVSMLEIDAKGWTVRHVEVTDPNTGDPLDNYSPVPSPWVPKPGYGPGVLVGRQSGTSANQRCGFTRNIYQQTLTRLTFTTSDGTEYEFRDQLTGGAPATVSNPCGSGASRGTVFITADGTSATFISDTTINDRLGSWSGSMIFPSGYLMLRDGVRYRIDSGAVTWMRDRNGNKLSFSSNSTGMTITDSLNRQVAITYANYSSTFSDQITFKGFGGASRTIFVNYATLSNALRTTNPRNEPAGRYQIQTYHGLFPELNNASSHTTWNPWVVSSVTLPNNQQYQLFYDCYAELARINVPTGGAIEYDYTAGSGAITDGVDYQIYRRVVERRVYPDGSNLEGYTTYSPTTATVVEDHLNPSGVLLAREKHYYNGDPTQSLFQSAIDYAAKLDGREYQSEQYAADGATLLRREQSTWVNRAPVNWWWNPGDATEPPNDPRVSDTTTTLADVSPNLVSKQTFGYDDTVPYNNRNDVKEYDFGNGSPGALVRETGTTYVTSTSYTDASSGAHIRSLPSQVSVYDAGGTERARTTMEYDNYTSDANHAGLFPRSSISGLDSAYTTSYTTRGNATATTHYLLVNGSVTGSVTGYAQYDIAGNIIKAIDARGNVTTITYDDCFGAPDGEATINTSPVELSSVGQASYAFPTVVTNAANQTVNSQFDYYLGRPVDGRDTNGVVASGYYGDALDRPTQVRRAIGVLGVENQTTFAYDDATRTVTTTSDLTGNNDNALVGKVLYDGLGRTSEARQYEGGTNYIATQTQYDAMGRAYKTSNPFRPWQNESAVWTTSAFDALSRVTSVTTPDSAAVTSSYSGNTVTVTDQAGKARKSVTDGLGRLATVYEDPSGLNYSTSYAFDVLDDLTTVSQGVQTRTFAYDSLKRLTSASNPESGTVSYTYDNNGNLLSKTDPRSITTTIAYDALNRATSKSYNDSPQTPTVSYFYDSQTLPSGAPSFDRGSSTGRLVAVTYGSGSSAGTYRGYDAMGRVIRQYQQTDSVNYLVEATYNLAGGVATETYPSVPGAGDRRTVSFSYDSAARLSSLSSSATSYAPAASVSSIGYASHNALNTETYGNSLIHGVTYNNRLQANEIKLGTTGNPTCVVDLTYNYGTTNNNGNLQGVNYSGGGLSYTQTFSYDSLNRLQTAQENSGSSWSQTNGYDQYGNRWIDYGGGNHNLSFSTSTNRITTSGLVYDSAGNLTNDTIHAYTFDAENKISKVDAVTAYTYDGEGQRVRKLVGENTRFVYGVGGQLVAEYDGSTGNLKKEYIYGSSMITIEPTAVNSNGTRYTTSDHLGSPRVVTNSGASVVSRHDYLPFGEELSAGTGGRTTAQGYTANDGIRQHFTQKERDNETGLDFFEARYYSSVQGRFTSPDEFKGGPEELYNFADSASDNPTFYADLRKPQSLNKYQYSFNNPLRYVDPDGHDPEEPEPPQNPKPVIPVPVPVGPGGMPMPVPVNIGPAPAGPTDQQIIRGVESVLDTVCDYTGITKLADWLRPKIMPTPAQPTTAQPLTTTPPTPIVQPMPPPPPAEARHRKERPSTKDKHQAPRPGRPTTKNRQDPDWRPRQRPNDWPKGKPWPPWKEPKN
jgi:RHS repeat-associated protein